MHETHQKIADPDIGIGERAVQLLRAVYPNVSVEDCRFSLVYRDKHLYVQVAVSGYPCKKFLVRRERDFKGGVYALLLTDDQYQVIEQIVSEEQERRKLKRESYSQKSIRN